jgi:hypothetical protein
MIFSLVFTLFATIALLLAMLFEEKGRSAKTFVEFLILLAIGQVTLFLATYGANVMAMQAYEYLYRG